MPMMYIHYLQTTHQLGWSQANNLVYQAGQNQQEALPMWSQTETLRFRVEDTL